MSIYLLPLKKQDRSVKFAFLTMIRSPLIYFLLVSINLMNAQDVKVNQDGEKIVVFKDGSWRYYEAKDSLLALNSKDGVNSNPNSTNKDHEYNFDTYQNYLSVFKRYEVNLLEKIRNTEKTITGLNVKLAGDIEKDSPEVIRSTQDSLNEARELLETYNSDLHSIRQSVAKVEKIGVKGNYKKLRTIRLPAQSNPDTLYTAQEDMDKTIRSNVLMNTNTNVNSGDDLSKPLTNGERKRGIKMPWSKTQEDKLYSGKEFQTPFTSSPIYNQYFHPATPAYVCDFTYDGQDDLTSNNRRVLAPEVFFTFTDTRLKPYLKDREYITCYGNLSSFAGGFRYVTLQFKIASRNARKEYGYLRSGTLLNIVLINGKTVSLFSQNGDPGSIDPRTGDTVYKALFPIDAKKEKLLSHHEVDRIRVVWSSGYEDYEIYNIDFFMNQLKCLTK